MRRNLLIGQVSALALVLSVASVPVGETCHLPEHVRLMGHEFSPEQMRLMSLGDINLDAIAYELEAAAPCVNGQADIFSCDGIDLLANVPLNQIGGGSGNDLWGWTDPVTGTEYALVGRSNGTSFLDLSDPENPIYLGNLASAAGSSTWRDIKVYEDHAFIVADFAGDHGMQIFDLTELRSVNNPPVNFSETENYGGIERAHNIVINEDTGFAYAVGSETCNGGLHMIDIQNPTNPVFAGCFSGDGYTHDAQCVVYNGPDTEHQGKEICFASNEDTVTIVDVTNKNNPVELSRNGYPGAAYTHQGWLTPDQQYFVHDDELDELFQGHNTRTYVWDVSNLDNATLALTKTGNLASSDHNQYVEGDISYQAHYTSGLRMLDVSNAASGTATEVAFFDTYPDNNAPGFSGAWSTYPYFGSGIVLVSDINRGLFVLQPQELLDAELDIVGGCPGAVTITASNVTPGARVGFAWGTSLGNTTIPTGSCAGTNLGIAGAQLLTTVTADGSGNAVLSSTAPSAACGNFLQALDVSNCEATNVITVD